MDGRYNGAVAHHFDEIDKRDFALGVAAELGVDPSRCAAVGDSRSDLPLFAAAGFAVAFNATGPARAAAGAVVDGDDLRLILPLLAAWYEGGQRPARTAPASAAVVTPGS
ncbi:HAD hydrolase family protein [Symbioplanes lichenis]|uniref:HAD hydrolase family protein n=1 Tax=Symbioplanes lichenis TaxID=1629072 RepID=UPI00273A22FF|nr:HAD hydrolase family protein [Actinoplanes lichenis]